MEHVKLAHGGLHAGLHGAARAGVLRGGPVKPQRGGVRCWVLAAGIALAVTFVFVGITLWLGLSAATRVAAPAERPRDPFRDLRVAPAPQPHAHPQPHPQPHHQPPPPVPTRQPPPPAAHLPKKRKGQVEKVQQPDATGGDAVAVATPAPSTTSSTTTTTTTTSTTTTSTTPAPAPEEQEPITQPPPPRRELEVEVLARQPLQSGVVPPAPPPALAAPPPAPLRPSPPPRRPPPRGWSPPPPPSAPWSPPLELRPPPVPPPVLLPADDPMVAEAAAAPEWRHGLVAEPPMAVDEPFRYDGAAPEEADSPVLVFVQERLRSLKEWLAATHAGQDWQDMVGAVNASLYRADPAPALRHLREMYYNTSLSGADGEVPLASLVYPTDPAVLSNSSSLVSFGLLAFDLLLLRNVQLLARGEDGPAGQRAEQLMNDPEVQALGALFMPPQEVRQLLHQDQDSAQLSLRMRAGGADEEDASGEEVTLGAVVQEVTSFLSSGLRAVLNLGRAYRATVAAARRASTASAAQQRDGQGWQPTKSPLDCLWTLYCRSLDKTARLTGPYGFLAKLNGLGLRLLLGTVPVDQALDLLVREATLGWGGMDCGKLFPRCSAEDAVPVVLDTAMGRTPVL